MSARSARLRRGERAAPGGELREDAVCVHDFALLPIVTEVPAQPSIRQQQIQFKKGESAATLKGSLKGDQMIDYNLRAGAGQSMVVIFTPTSKSACCQRAPARLGRGAARRIVRRQPL
jgi:hypothetical protein